MCRFSLLVFCCAMHVMAAALPPYAEINSKLQLQDFDAVATLISSSQEQQPDTTTSARLEYLHLLMKAESSALREDWDDVMHEVDNFQPPPSLKFDPLVAFLRGKLLIEGTTGRHFIGAEIARTSHNQVITSKEQEIQLHANIQRVFDDAVRSTPDLAEGKVLLEEYVKAFPGLTDGRQSWLEPLTLQFLLLESRLLLNQPLQVLKEGERLLNQKTTAPQLHSRLEYMMALALIGQDKLPDALGRFEAIISDDQTPPALHDMTATWIKLMEPVKKNPNFNRADLFRNVRLYSAGYLWKLPMLTPLPMELIGR